MDKLKLTEEQLTRVIAYIDGRGFHDPGVIVEILDHFACKVEEKMEQYPGLALDEAMSQAHADFGALGFYPLLASYERTTIKKYKQIYNEQRRKVLSNLLYVLPAFFASFMVYKYYGWADVHAKLWGINLFAGAVSAIYIAVLIYHYRKFSIVKRKNKVYEAIMARDILFVITMLVPHIHEEPMDTKAVVVYGLLCAVTFFYLIIQSLAMNATLDIGKKEVDIVYDFLENKKSRI